jgi:hypothetical protein
MNINKSKTPMRFYTIAQVADFMGNHERTVRRWIKRGWLVALSRQPLPTLDRTRYAPAAGVARGVTPSDQS